MRLKSYANLFSKINSFHKKYISFASHHSVILPISKTFSQWDIVGAVCLERKPIISQSLSLLEQRYFKYIQKLEVEKSFLSDHEKRHTEDKKLAEKLKLGNLNDMDVVSKQTAQDFEDACNKEFNKHKPASRKTDADVCNDKQSTQRKLDSSLVFVIKQKIGNDFRWMLPQTVHEEGETLRQTAERALKQVASYHSNIQFLGNAPVGYYKYKYPKEIRGNGIYGAKVFFFKAHLLNIDESVLAIKQTDLVSDYLWLSHLELKEVLQPVLCKAVQSFLYPDSLIVENNDVITENTDDDEQISSSLQG